MTTLNNESRGAFGHDRGKARPWIDHPTVPMEDPGTNILFENGTPGRSRRRCDCWWVSPLDNRFRLPRPNISKQATPAETGTKRRHLGSNAISDREPVGTRFSPGKCPRIDRNFTSA